MKIYEKMITLEYEVAAIIYSQKHNKSHWDYKNIQFSKQSIQWFSKLTKQGFTDLSSSPVVLVNQIQFES